MPCRSSGNRCRRSDAEVPRISLSIMMSFRNCGLLLESFRSPISLPVLDSYISSATSWARQEDIEQRLGRDKKDIEILVPMQDASIRDLGKIEARSTGKIKIDERATLLSLSIEATRGNNRVSFRTAYWHYHRYRVGSRSNKSKGTTQPSSLKSSIVANE
jgi:hypothetical protein